MSRAARWLLAGGIAFQIGGCMTDNLLRSVFAQNLTQTFAVGVQAANSLVFGLPDTILNLAVYNFLATLGI